MEKEAKIYVAGHQGLVGSAIVRALQSQGFSNIVMRTLQELDLRNQQAVNHFFATEKLDYVFLAAAKVGGIVANATYPADFIYDNLAIALHVIDAAYRNQVKKMLFLGSSCIYPRSCPQPIREEYLLSSQLEQTNEPYALAKIAGLKLCESYNRQYGTHFITCMPTNLYGPGDNFHPATSHVIPALLRKFIEAKRDRKTEVVVWGTGAPYREFLYVDDLANACLFLMEHYTGNQLINVGTGTDIMIKDLANLIKKEVGFQGDIVFDTSKPDGTPRKLLNIDKLTNLGWCPSTPLEVGIRKTIAWCNQHELFC
jgi:GDP-L-fucose synthase